MPQLDLISFFPQIFWCFVLFLLFFFTLSFLYIPQIATILKYRKKKLLVLANEINAKKDGSSRLLTEYDSALNSSFKETANLLKNLQGLGGGWLSSTAYTLNTTSFKKVNQRFLFTSFFKDSVK